MRRRWRRARGGSGAGGEGTELDDDEEPIMLRSIDIAVRKRDVVLRNADEALVHEPRGVGAFGSPNSP